MHEKPNSAAATALRRNFDYITDIIAFPFRLVPNTLFTICLVAQLRALPRMSRQMRTRNKRLALPDPNSLVTLIYPVSNLIEKIDPGITVVRIVV
jgi:hypothetical protein